MSRGEVSDGVAGFGLFSGEVRHFKNFHQPSAGLKVPHMGWNRVRQEVDHPLWHGIDQEAWFYFVHSYCANFSEDADQSGLVGETSYGHRFVSAVANGKLFATQFHPEKSHSNGLKLLKNFVEWTV